MSSWGWGSKFSNLQAVSDFSIFGSKSSHVQGVILKFWVFFFFNFRLGILKDAQVPDSFDGITIGRCVHHIFILKVWFPIKKTSAKPPAERSEASRKSITSGGFQPGVTSRLRYLLQNEYNSRWASGTWSATSRLSNHNVPPGSSENPYGEARSAEFDGTGGTGWTGNKSVL